MFYDYDRKFFCLIRWVSYLVGTLFILAGAYRFGGFIIAFSFILTRVEAKPEQALAMRYKWYGASCILYYLILLIYVIAIKGKVFHIPGFVLFFIVPFIPEIIIYEIKEYRGK